MNPAQGKKLAFALLVAVPILAVADVVQFLSVERVVNTHRRLAQSSRILAEATATGAALREAEVKAREFLASGDAKALASFQAQEAEAKESIQQLLKLTAGNAELLARVRKLESLVTQRLDLLRKSIDLRSRPPVSPDAQKGLETEGGKQMAAIVTALAELRKAEADKLPMRVSDANAAIERATFLTPLCSALGLWLVLLAALVLYRDARARTWAGVERRLHTRVVELLPVALCLVDDSGLIFYTNSSADALFGYEPGGLVGRHITALHSSREEGTQFFDDIVACLGLKGTWAGEFAGRKKNGAGFTCLAHASNMNVPGKTYRMFICEDAAESQRP
ncbi:MAG: CHASE3 domain-containing protein [Acidobacteriia bacterium]|nr:CHASE3 domain-containing protein [Terriglobia bacterium]